MLNVNFKTMFISILVLLECKLLGSLNLIKSAFLQTNPNAWQPELASGCRTPLSVHYEFPSAQTRAKVPLAAAFRRQPALFPGLRPAGKTTQARAHARCRNRAEAANRVAILPPAGQRPVPARLGNAALRALFAASGFGVRAAVSAVAA